MARTQFVAEVGRAPLSTISMTHEWPHALGDDRRVVRFRPHRPPVKGNVDRNRRARPSPQDPEPDSVVPSLAKFERREAEDDYRHRMAMNLIVFSLNLLLIVLGVWMLGTIRGN
jgi:hypothetical protein